MMVVLPVMLALFTAIMSVIPFIGHPSRPVGLIDLATFAKGYVVLSAFHAVRLYKLMLHPHKEVHSQYEGAALPFFQLIPFSWARSFWVTRVAIEPLFVLLVATVLEDAFLIQPSLAIYLKVAAIALAAKSAVTWYRAWEYTRILLDNKAAADIVTKLVDDKASPEEAAQIHLVTFAPSIPADMRAEAAGNIARAYAPTLNSTQR